MRRMKEEEHVGQMKLSSAKASVESKPRDEDA